MKVFILEDDPSRMAWFRERLKDHDITHADSCAQVDRFQPPYDVVFLDHDLGGRQLDAHEDNGEAFAKLVVGRLLDSVSNATPKTVDFVAMSEPPFRRRPSTIVVIHSYNADGARNIRAVIGGGFIAPFRTDWFHSLVNTYL